MPVRQFVVYNPEGTIDEGDWGELRLAARRPLACCHRGSVSKVPETYRVVLGHRFGILQDGLRLNIAKFSERLKVIGTASTAEDLFALLAGQETDLILVGLDLPGYEGSAILRALAERFPDRRVAVLTAKEETLAECMRYNACGFILKREPAARIVRAIETIAAGGTYVTPDVGRRAAARADGSAAAQAEGLSSRERELLLLVAEGLRNTDIAERLGIRLRTVEFHKTNLKRKLQARTSGELIRIAYERRLIE